MSHQPTQMGLCYVKLLSVFIVTRPLITDSRPVRKVIIIMVILIIIIIIIIIIQAFVRRTMSASELNLKR